MLINRVVLLLFVSIIDFIGYAQLSNFPETVAGDCSGTTLNYNHNISFTAPGTADVPSDVSITFCISGDYGSSTNGEGVDVYGESGTNLGFYNRDDSDFPAYSDCNATEMCISFTITQAQWNLWNDDGSVDLTIIPTNPVNFCTNYSCLGSVTADYSRGPAGLTSNLTIWLKADYGVYEDGAATDTAENGDAICNGMTDLPAITM